MTAQTIRRPVSLARRRRGRTSSGKAYVVWLLAVLIGVMVGVSCLPHNRFIRFQTLRGTLHERAEWVYERIHDDPTPIDVLIVGSSRTAAALDPVALQGLLSADAGLKVANLSFAEPGTDLAFFVLREALRTRSVKIAVVGVSSHESKQGHPAFKDLADVEDLLHAPVLVNWRYLSNIAYIPMRELKLFAASIAPGLFGYRTVFDPGAYPGPDIDLRHRFPVIPSRTKPRDEDRIAAAIDADRRRYERDARRVYLPAALADVEFASERVYFKAMAALCGQYGTKLVFVYLPFYAGRDDMLDTAFYGRLGPVLFPPASITADPKNYDDVVHLDERGSRAMTAWLADRLKPFMAGTAEPSPASPDLGDPHGP